MSKIRIALIAFMVSTIIWLAMILLIGAGYLILGLIVVPITTAIWFIALVVFESLLAKWPRLRNSAHILGLVGGAIMGATFYFMLFFGVGYTASLVAQYAGVGAIIGLCAVSIYMYGRRNA